MIYIFERIFQVFRQPEPRPSARFLQEQRKRYERQWCNWDADVIRKARK